MPTEYVLFYLQGSTDTWNSIFTEGAGEGEMYNWLKSQFTRDFIPLGTLHRAIKNCTQCQKSWEKCKLKTQWDITSHLSEWLSTINQQTAVGENVEKREPSALVAGMQTGAATIKKKTTQTVWRVLKKLKTELPYDPAILLLCIHLKTSKTLIQKNVCTLHSQCYLQ